MQCGPVSTELNLDFIWNKVFKSGLSKFYGRRPLKILKGYGLLKQTIPFKFFKGCLPQNLLSSLLNTLSHIKRLLKRSQNSCREELGAAARVIVDYVRIIQSVSGRNKCMCCSSHALCYGRVRPCAIHNSFAFYDGDMSFLLAALTRLIVRESKH